MKDHQLLLHRSRRIHGRRQVIHTRPNDTNAHVRIVVDSTRFPVQVHAAQSAKKGTPFSSLPMLLQQVLPLRRYRWIVTSSGRFFTAGALIWAGVYVMAMMTIDFVPAVCGFSCPVRVRQ